MLQTKTLLCFLFLSVILSSCALHQKNLKGDAGASGAFTEENNLLGNSTFSGKSYLPWTVSFTSPGVAEGKLKDGAFCVEVENKGINNWDAQFRHREMTIVSGRQYHIEFKIWSDKPTMTRYKVGMSGPPYEEYWADVLDITTEPQRHTATFTMNAKDDPTAEFAFHIGGDMAVNTTGPYTVCIDDVVLADPEFSKKDSGADAPVPNILVNQTGYYPQLEKFATVRNESTTPIKWELIGNGNKVLTTGETTVFGLDKDSGDTVHTLNFTDFTTPGEGYVLKVGDDKSHPFDIRDDIYSRLKYDALKFFYHQRQGIDIAMPYAEKKQWAHPAGHTGDVSIPCLPKNQYYGKKTPYEGCDYKLDVSKGWYDAGDHGKYLVNGGITVWSLLNWYERTQHLGGSPEAFADGKGNIPEGGNGVPDILDEARWEIEFFLNMQVPEGKPRAGMVHHKVADNDWTALAIWPHEVDLPRYLHPPSTTATLNMAASVAMAARIWKEIDAEFAQKCLLAAERAFAAAVKYPEEWASSDAGHGSGPYDDSNADDEFYWAAAELFITTGKNEYKKAMTSSPFFKTVPVFVEGGDISGTLNWRFVAPAGSLSLAVVPNKLPRKDIKDIHDALIKAGDEYAGLVDKQGYRLPMSGKYVWGSSSYVLSGMMVLGLAYDISKDKRHLNAMASGMDYFMGRNPMDITYVTGYGERPFRNPHHRFWAYQADPAFPKAPPGIISGGPNTELQDPMVNAAGLQGCSPLKCFLDHIEAWCVSEIAINWNGMLVWVSSYLDEQARQGESP